MRRQLGKRDNGLPPCTKCGGMGPFRFQGNYRRTTCMKCDSEQNSRRNKIRRYGVDGRQFTEWVVKQKGLCFVCGEPPNEKGLVVDHNHKTGEVRSLLCDRCNMVLGFVQDNTGLLKKMIVYLGGEKNAIQE